MIDNPARALEVNDATYAAWNAHDPDAVAEDHHYLDLAGLLTQLGAIG
jgi:hypothetical protein